MIRNAFLESTFIFILKSKGKRLRCLQHLPCMYCVHMTMFYVLCLYIAPTICINSNYFYFSVYFGWPKISLLNVVEECLFIYVGCTVGLSHSKQYSIINNDRNEWKKLLYFWDLIVSIGFCAFQYLCHVEICMIDCQFIIN